MKRRRLNGKQSVPEEAAAPMQDTPEQRSRVRTMVRDHWVATEMRVQGLSGHAARVHLKSVWKDVAADTKLSQLSSMVFSGALRSAAATVETEWKAEVGEPLIAGEAAVTRYRGLGTMMRWSGPWSVLDSVPAAASVDQLCVTLREHPLVEALWQEFVAFFERLQKHFHLARWTIALELHCEVTAKSGVPSVHFHAMFDSSQTVTLQAANLRFKLANPYISVDAPRARGRCTRRAFDQGHYYLQVPKIGAIQMATNYPACHAFPLTPEWVTNLWATQKIASSTAKAEYVRAKKHIRNYLENVDYHAQCEADRAIAERKKAAEAALLPLQKQAKRIELVDTLFLPQFLAPMFRRKFLVLTGHHVWAKQFLLVPWRAPPRLSWWIVARLNSPTCVSSTL